MKFDIPPLRLLLAAALLALAGCAAQNAYRDGQSLIAEGRDREGLARLEEASRLEPTDGRYRMAVLQTRERLAAAEARRADALVAAGKLDEAEQAVRQSPALGLDTARAQALLASIAAQRRVAAAVADARAAMERKDTETARARLHAALLEAPNHAEANSLMRQVEEASSRPPPETVLAAAYRKPITIEFKDAALKSVFEVISRSSGLNFIFDKDVKTDQKTSIFLKNSSIEAAVQLTLLTNQLEQRVLDGNTILIYPNTAAKQKDYQPLTVKSFYLANGDAKTVAASLKALLKTRDVVVDEKLNLVIVRDSPEAIRLAEKVVALHDVPEPEVMMEVEILEVKRTSLLDLGVRWPSQVALTPLPLTSGGTLTVDDLRHLDRSRIGVAVDPLTIRANKTDSDANLLANPRIRARNHEKAKILIGQRVPNITTTATSTGFVAESVNYVDVGLKLDVEPTIYLDGEVAIKISLEVSSIISQLQTKAGSIAYEIGTRTAQTVLRLKDGENQILAGLINDEDRKSGDRIPGLGDIPVAGRLFGQQSNDASKTEIVLSITPRIVRNVRRPDPALLEFESGTESSLGGRAGSGGAASPPAAAPAAAPAPAARPASGARPGLAPITGDAQAPAPTAATAPPASGGAGPVASPGTASASFLGPKQLKAGDTFSLQFVLASDQPIVSVPFALGFDPQALQVLTVAEGDFMRQGAAQTAFASRVDPKGQVIGTVTRSGNTGAVGQGSVATVNFRVAATGATQAQVQMITVAPVTLGGAQVPVPSVAPFTVQVAPGG